MIGPIILFCAAIFALIGYVGGYYDGEQKCKREAVKNKKARWVTDDDSNVNFEWLP